MVVIRNLSLLAIQKNVLKQELSSKRNHESFCNARNLNSISFMLFFALPARSSSDDRFLLDYLVDYLLSFSAV